MRVILKENVENLGNIGEIVKVSNGYARNYLIPRSLATIADEGNVKAVEHQQRVLEKKRKLVMASAEEVSKKLAEHSCTISRKVGENDKLYGSVTSADVADELAKSGFKIDKRSIQLEEPIRALGVHSVSVKVAPEVVATLKVWVVKEKEG